MLTLAVYNKKGEEIDKIKVDEADLGGSIRYPLLKDAIVMYHTNKRVGTAANKSRGMVEGSTRKVYKQKGTGNARMGTIRTAKRVGGGVTFAKIPHSYRKFMPKKQRKLARNSAILAKLLANNVVVVDELGFEKPKTKEFVKVLENLKIERSCLVTVNSVDENLFKSVRNVPRVSIMPVGQLNAGDICSYKRMLFTKEALVSILNEDKASNN